MNTNLLILPIIMPLITAIVLLFFWFRPNRQKYISLVGHILSVLVAIPIFLEAMKGTILTMAVGNWAAPFGIVYVCDAFSGALVLLTSLVGLAVGIYSNAAIQSKRASYGYFPLVHFLLMGLYGSFLAGDIFNLYVWFEVIIIASFVLITLGGEKAQLEGAVKYVTMNLLASVIFLTGIAVLYGILGTLNLADLSLKVSESPHRSLINATAILFLVGFGIKSAIFPLYFWLPDSYHTPPTPISAIFGGLLTKVGVYALIRIFSLLFIGDPFIRDLLSWIAVLTMISGAFGAIVSYNLRKIFSYLIVSHIGFMIAGLALFSPIAIAGAAYYMMHDIIAKTNLFLVGGTIYKIKGQLHIDRVKGLFSQYPYLSIVFALAMFSVVGTPPLSGFWPKIMLLKGSFAMDNMWIIVGILLATFLTLWAMVRIWSKSFWSTEANEEKTTGRYQEMTTSQRRLLIGPILFLLAISLFLGFGAGYVSQMCSLIADQLMDSDTYVNAVLGITNLPEIQN